MPGVYVFEGKLNFAALELSFDLLFERHEILRTIFKENEQGETKQIILEKEDIGFKVSYQDLRTNYNDQNPTVKELVQQELFSPFDLVKGPLVRAGLYHLENHKWLFTYVMHHIISDGWSMGILIKELLLLYDSINQGKLNELPPLRIHYKDYAPGNRSN